MSGDVQPRKRKDKRRKKEGESLGNIHDVPGAAKFRSVSSERDESPVRSQNSDENIHVHHDHGIGGNACVKVIFFALLAVLLGLVGLIFIESRGSTDVDLPSIEESRFAEYFTGWLDDSPDEHGHDDHAAASEEAEHDDDDHDEHDDHDDGHAEEEHSEEPEEEDAGNGSEDGAGTEEEEEEENDDEVTGDSQDQEQNEDDQSAAQVDIDDSEEEEKEDDDEEEEEEEEDDDEKEDSDEIEDASEDVEDDNDEDDEEEEEEEEDDDDDDDDDEDFDLTQEDESGEENVQQVKKTKEPDSGIASNEEEEEAEESEDVEQDEDEESDAKEETEEEEDDEEEEAADEDEESDEGDQGHDLVASEEEVEEIEESEEALREEEEAVKKEKLSLLEDDEDLEDISDIKLRKKKERELLRKLEKMLKEQEKEAQSGEDGEEGNDEQEESQETGGVAMKLGVGVALIVVAHVVVVRRWRQLSNASEAAAEETEKQEEETTTEVEEPVVSRRQTLIPETAQLPEPEEEEEEEEEEKAEPIKRRTSVDVKRERQDPSKYYTKEELGDSEDLDDEEELGEEEEYIEDEEVEDEELEEEEEEEFELEGSQTPSDLGEPEEEEEEEEDEPPPVPPPRAQPVSAPRRGPQGLEEEDLLEVNSNNVNAVEEDEVEDGVSAQEDSIENAPERTTSGNTEPKLADDDDDWLFRQELDFADEQFNNNPEAGLEKYNSIISRAPNSLRAALGRARSLDKLAEVKRSNPLLNDAIKQYQTLLLDRSHKMDDQTFRDVAQRCVNRMRFAGKNLQAAVVHEALATRFPNEPEHPNALAVSFLLSGRNKEAQKVLEATLKRWPNDGFAQVHLGFVLKTAGLLEEGAKLLEQGIRSNHSGTMDGRFLFHLGDALQRLGSGDKAMQWYELGVQNKIFKSKYQRSLYNVDRLKAQPWWSLQDTTYQDFFSSLERNWKKIREEGVKLLEARDKMFQDEAESLKDTGDWKQLDLFSRGRKQAGCARAPLTCQLIAAFSPAGTCTRGQAKFSVMQPGTHVWPHCGPTNCRLRAHLGLIVPQGVFLRVSQQTKSWEEGKVFVFDDSFEHEVWHNGSSVRLVLIVDVWHPELTSRERETLSPI